MNLSPQHVAYVISVAVGIGLLLPLLQALVQRPHWTPRTKAVLAVCLSVLGGLAGYIVDHGLDFSDPAKIAVWIVGVYGASSTLYARLLRPSGVTDKIEASVNAGEPAPRRAIDPNAADDGPDDPADTVNDGTNAPVGEPVHEEGVIDPDPKRTGMPYWRVP